MTVSDGDVTERSVVPGVGTGSRNQCGRWFPDTPNGVRGTTSGNHLNHDHDREPPKGALEAPASSQTETIHGWQPWRGERLGVAWELLLIELSDGNWHSWPAVVAAVTPRTTVQHKTVANLIRGACANGYLVRKGRYYSPRRDTRLIRLHPMLRQSISGGGSS
jgi:hypothetical protein